ncbi:hypothetical protein Tco_1553108, partial [Tanacetum coccineum]
DNLCAYDFYLNDMHWYAMLYDLSVWFFGVATLRALIIPPTMTTRSANRPTAASRGGGMGGRAGSGGGRTRGRSGDQGDGRIDGQG